jgi:hypothetical protein
MRYDVPPGDSIHDHAVTMQLLADTFGRNVVAAFNGYWLTARPGGTRYDIIREWDHAAQISCFGRVIYDE